MTQDKIDEAPAGGGDRTIPAERVRQRAYELWERNHCPPGLELRFWLLAERQLRAEAEPDGAEGAKA